MLPNPVKRFSSLQWRCELPVKETILVFLITSLMVSVSGSPVFGDTGFDAHFEKALQVSANQPSDIAIGADGSLFLVDGVNHRIVVVEPGGRIKSTFGKQGTGPGEFRFPLGICITDDGRIFVADTGNRRIQIFDSRFKHIGGFPVVTWGTKHPADPVDVLVSRLDGNVYISDNDNHSIRVYKQNGEFLFRWGKFGEGSGEFRYPGMLFSNDANEIFVVDVLNTRVQKFDPFGGFIADIGSWGVLPGRLFRPKGVVVDKFRRVFISDSYLGVVQVFSDQGQFLGVVSENGEKMKFRTPVGMAINEDTGKLYIVEMRENRINVVGLKN